MFASLNKETAPKEVISKKEEALSHRIATSILYNLRLESHLIKQIKTCLYDYGN